MSSSARTSAGSVTGLLSRLDSRNRAASSTSRSGLGPEPVPAGDGPPGTRSSGPAGQSSGSCASTALLPLPRVTEVAALLGYVHEARPPGAGRALELWSGARLASTRPAAGEPGTEPR